MIIDRLFCFRTYLGLHKNFSKVLDFLAQNSLKDLKEGRYPILGEDVFLSINCYETKANKDFEVHRRYIDLQIVLEGMEYIDWCPLSQTQAKTAYDENQDVMFLSGIGQTFKASEDLFFVFFPEDAHRPGLWVHKPDYVKKAIFKIKL